MDINKLETFLAVANYGSFKEAAEHLFLSPRAVSKQMNQVESELNVKLFHRQNNRTSLTTFGKAFTVTAQDIVNTYNNALTRIKVQDEANIKKLRAGISSLIQATIWQTSLTDFLEKNKQINIEIEEESGQRLLSLINKELLDFCVCPYYEIQIDNENFPNIQKIDLFRGELYIGISKLNPLSDQKSISLLQLSNMKALYYTPFGSSSLKKTFLKKFKGLIKENQIQPISTLEERNLLVAINKGFGFYPSITVDEEELQNPLINFLPIRNNCNKTYASSLWYNKNNTNPILRKLIKHLKHSKKLALSN